MKRLLAIFNIFLAGCTIGNGHICGPQTPKAYCDKDAYEKLMHPKPYGAHWVKEGMTRESRLDDIATCGANRSLDIRFSNADISHVMRFAEIQRLEGHQFASTEQVRWVAANDRLTDAWRQCMKTKGYEQRPMGTCDVRCLYP